MDREGNPFDDPVSRIARVRWRCRRGMRELDELLVGFFDACFHRLTDSERLAFERLLEAPDQELLVWLTGGAYPMDGELERVVRSIRGYHGR